MLACPATDCLVVLIVSPRSCVRRARSGDCLPLRDVTVVVFSSASEGFLRTDFDPAQLFCSSSLARALVTRIKHLPPIRSELIMVTLALAGTRRIPAALPLLPRVAALDVACGFPAIYFLLQACGATSDGA